AISIIGGLLSSASQKQAVEMLQAAQRKSEAITNSGLFVDFEQVTNSHSPHPNVWSASISVERNINVSQLGKAATDILLAKYGKSDADVVKHGQVRVLPVEAQRRLVHNGDEFLNVET